MNWWIPVRLRAPSPRGLPRESTGIVVRRYPPLTTILRFVWIAAILCFEVAIFPYTLSNCHWPDSPSPSGSKNAHILLLADPQILHDHSYPERSRYLRIITELIVDLNIRRNWRAAMATGPDTVIFLGDMMDNGRGAISDEEYEKYYKRFKSIFSNPESIPTYYLPGNHDIGFGASKLFSPYAHSRFVTHFGPLNQHFIVANHTMVLMDAVGLVEEDYRRWGRRVSYDQWHASSGGTVEFVKTFGARKRDEPVILLSHIPLWRPDGLSCGPLRERGTIRPGVGFGYQTMLGKETTTFLLNAIRPVVVFSGDDHDYCEISHELNNADAPIKEVTVKSLSMAMGIRQPGFQLLSLNPESRTHADIPCSLPSALYTYLSIYTPLAIFSLATLLIVNVVRTRRSSRSAPRDQEYQPQTVEDQPHPRMTSSFPAMNRSPRPRTTRELYNTHKFADEDAENDYDYPSFPLRPRRSAISPPRTNKRRMTRSPMFGKRELLVRFARDVVSVGALPAGLWILLAFWTFYGPA